MAIGSVRSLGDSNAVQDLAKAGLQHLANMLYNSCSVHPAPMQRSLPDGKCDKSVTMPVVASPLIKPAMYSIAQTVHRSSHVHDPVSLGSTSSC